MDNDTLSDPRQFQFVSPDTISDVNNHNEMIDEPFGSTPRQFLFASPDTVTVVNNHNERIGDPFGSRLLSHGESPGPIYDHLFATPSIIDEKDCSCAAEGERIHQEDAPDAEVILQNEFNNARTHYQEIINNWDQILDNTCQVREAQMALLDRSFEIREEMNQRSGQVQDLNNEIRDQTLGLRGIRRQLRQHRRTRRQIRRQLRQLRRARRQIISHFGRYVASYGGVLVVIVIPPVSN
jgi:hypothetical protein